MKTQLILIIFVAFIFGGCSKPITTVTVESNSPAIQGSQIGENIGIETLGGVMTPLLFAGCTTPCKTSEIFSTAADGQKKFEVTMFRGLKDITSENTKLGKYEITGFSEAPRGEPQIEVFFEVGDGKITLSAVDLSHGAELKIKKVD